MLQSAIKEEGDSRKRKNSANEAASELDHTARCKLHDACTRILNRCLRDGDVMYDIFETEGGQVAKIKLPGLPGAWGSRSWLSKPCLNRRQARLSAADAALRSLMEDPEMALAIDVPRLENSRNAAQDESSAGDFMDISSSSAYAEDGLDPKTKVVIFCQWSAGRPMQKGDLVYSTSRESGLFRATVKLNCFNGEEFSGASLPDRRQAENSAADAVLLAYRKQRAKASAPASVREDPNKPMAKRRRVQSDAHEVEAVEPGINTRLHEICVQLLGREPQAGDIMYEVAVTNEGLTAALRIPCLPAPLNNELWTSGSCTSRRDARMQAAAKAVKTILADPAYTCCK
mmetsp:Transcript_37402/g.66459  ORF Transcript_37402/g.66459 Transcript_37402/m.66459 type:complete len:344 (+) Transcript_37402:60-1091(+)